MEWSIFSLSTSLTPYSGFSVDFTTCLTHRRSPRNPVWIQKGGEVRSVFLPRVTDGDTPVVAYLRREGPGVQDGCRNRVIESESCPLFTTSVSGVREERLCHR